MTMNGQGNMNELYNCNAENKKNHHVQNILENLDIYTIIRIKKSTFEMMI